MTIQVKNDGRVLVDGVQYGCKYSTTAIANHEAQMLHDKRYPQAVIILCDTNKPDEKKG